MEPLRFLDWRALARGDPAAAARELYRRVATLSAAQRRAVVAWLPSEPDLAQEFASSPSGTPLQGIPFFMKDLADIAGVPTLAGSTFLPEVRSVPTMDSSLVLGARAAGAVCAGKTHLHEFAYGNTGENPNYGDCEHPHFPGRTTGGSSSGSAAAVAAGIVPIAFGTDTGGSIRVPAGFCGLFGYRMTPGHRWISDQFPLAPGFDTPGWFTGDARDMLDSLGVLVGLGSCHRQPRGCYLASVLTDPEVTEACRAAAERLCQPADEHTTRGLVQAFEHSGDAYSVLSSTEAAGVHASWLDSHRSRYSPAVWDRIDRGRRWTDAQRIAAELKRSVLKKTMTSFFLVYDFLVMPATATPALTKVECTPENRSRLLELAAPASLAGLPVLTLPVTLPTGLTTGLQLIVNHIQSPVIPWALKRWTDMPG